MRLREWRNARDFKTCGVGGEGGCVRVCVCVHHGAYVYRGVYVYQKVCTCIKVCVHTSCRHARGKHAHASSNM